MADLRIAVDAMGGDHAPRAIVEGALAAARRTPIAVALVGHREAIEDLGLDLDAEIRHRVSIVEAPDVVQMDESPLSALRRKPGASIRVAAELLKRGDADALFTAGHTGAALMAARTTLGVLPGADRPALAVTIPTVEGASILLDAGANVDCRPEHLVQFAAMGAAYARIALDVDAPSVGLLSIGSEAGKGNDLIREAHARLSAAPLAFLGNLEARDLFAGRAHVIVCDGFTGNVALKVSEGLVEAIERMLHDALTAADPGGQLGRALAPAVQRFKARVDYAQYGGAPLVGVNGVVVIGHGHSSAMAVENGVIAAAKLAGGGFVGRLISSLAG